MTRQGLSLLDQKPGKELNYGIDRHQSISFFHDDQEISSQVWGFAPSAVFQVLGQDVIGRAFAGVSEAAKPFLARSFNEFGHGVIRESELSGSLEFIDWFQYLSPGLVQRWSVDELRKALAAVDLLPSGACCLWLEGSPMDELNGRRHAAETLGVTLRPAIARNPKTGEPVVLPWT